MIQFLVAAPCSGSGKTTLTCALLAALKRRGQEPCSFKSGPDYIDPMFHRAVLGVESHNLDLFFSAPETVRALYAQAAAGHGTAVCEGAMGFYDGLGGVSDTASAWHLADTLGLPVLLVVQPRGASLTLAAQINGLKQFRTPSHLAGILLNDCAPHLYALLAPMLERETGLPVLGYLPHLPDAALESRHLGLKTAGEIADLQQKISRMADALVMDWEKLFALTECAAPLVHTDRLPPAGELLPQGAEEQRPRVSIAVARDAAFCFTYAETLEALERAGAELCWFSPLQDSALPEQIGGWQLRKLQIPTVFGLAAARTLACAAECRPDAVLCIGQAGTRSAVRPEYVGINLRHARIADNLGNQPQDEPVVPGGPTAYFATVPVRAMTAAIEAQGIPAAVSYTAGTYVCNDLLYTLLHHYAETPVRAGFIHVPFLPEQAPQGVASMPLAQMIRALEAAVSAL